MKKQRETVNGDAVTINYVETDRDVAQFVTWYVNTPYPVAVDTETSGLNIYAPDHRLKLVQFGDALNAYVLDAERFSDVIRDVLSLADDWRFTFHNGAYDMQVLARHGLATLDTFKGRYNDTKILAHLLDSRGREDGPPFTHKSFEGVGSCNSCHDLGGSFRDNDVHDIHHANTAN